MLNFTKFSEKAYLLRLRQIEEGESYGSGGIKGSVGDLRPGAPRKRVRTVLLEGKGTPEEQGCNGQP